ncbi:phage holin family protein [Nocardia veterana]|uniref:Phage holin family protein n=1 Tax=Nocardia veterana TaxID=132249 RepID=A0A7X6RI09_9NOCA|nr:phage holin family protein [Nocardia veterana]NKY86661.1 phage holin family protein [Nocardia veterana]
MSHIDTARPGTARSGAARPQESATVAELVGTASEQLSRLVREEMRLAAAEAQGKAKRLGAGAGLGGAAAVLALAALGAFVAAAILALALVVPAWGAALIVAGALCALAGLFGLAGRANIRKGTPPVPEHAVADVRQDLTMIKERGRR